MRRFYLAWVCFFRVLFRKPLPAELAAAPAVPSLPPPATPAAPARLSAAPPRTDVSAGALQLLALFQREGRLVDFLAEAIDAYDDAAIGAAVRDIHKGCKKVLAEHFRVEPVVEGDENEPYTVDDGFDPARIRLVGNVVGKPPFRGVLRHHGWRAGAVMLPQVGKEMDQRIVAPAEVELS
jgi:uncharacterized protein DUF2760